MKKNKEEMVRKISLLMKKAESAREIGSLAEAEAFAQKASKLLLDHNIAKHELDLEDKNTNNCIVKHVRYTEQFTYSKTDGDWIDRMYIEVSRYNFCDTVMHKGYYYYAYVNEQRKRFWTNPSINIIGEPHNIEVVEYIVSYLIPIIRKLQLKRWHEVKNYTTEKKNAFKRGYYRGAVSGIAVKLREQRMEAEKEHKQTLHGLVKVNEVMVKEKVQEAFPKLKMVKTRALSGQTGRSMGFKDGKNININKGING